MFSNVLDIAVLFALKGEKRERERERENIKKKKNKKELKKRRK